MFAGLSGRERGTAFLYFNNFRRMVERWTREASTMTLKYSNVDLWEYVGIDEYTTDRFDSLDAWRQYIARYRDILKLRARDNRDRWRANHRQRRGRTPPEGFFVWIAVAYNHGYGGYFVGYIGAEEGDYDPISGDDIQEAL